MEREIAKPGSDEAINLGCLCPVLDNAHGKGCYKAKGFIVSMKCPVHSVHNKREEVE